MRTVKQVSELAGVTARTLHHYDEIGLLAPSSRSEAGYRLYSYDDLVRLQEILVWRALGFSLAEIKALLDDRQYDRGSALRRQRELVELERERLAASARALDVALEDHEQGRPMKEATMFDGFDPSEYADEVRERWGHTGAYQESVARVAGYGETQWSEIRSESERIVRDFAALLGGGEDPRGERGRAVAERHRLHISRWFYPCSLGLHRGLGEMYVSDERFARGYERHAVGLAAYIREAIVANADAAAATLLR